MDRMNPLGVDGIIDAVLGGEPLRPMPPGLHHRIAGRLRVAALLEQERRRFRESVAFCIGALASAFCGTVLVAVLADVPGLIRHGIPGGLGRFDYLATSIGLYVSNLENSVTLASTSIVAVAAAMALLPLGGLLAHRTLRKAR